MNTGTNTNNQTLGDKIAGLSAFSAEYLTLKLGAGFEGLIGAVVSLDPDGASETQLNMMKSDLKKAALEFTTLGQDKQKELAEAVEAEKDYEKAKKLAAVTLKNINQAGISEELKARLTDKFNKVADEAELKKAKYNKEKLEADNITRLVDLLESIVDGKYAAIESARKALSAAKTNMAMIKAETQAYELEEDIKKMQNNSSNTLNIALNAMNKKTDKAKAELDAKKKIASLEKGSDIMNDEELNALLAEDEGKVELSLEDRLAAL